MQGWEFNYQQQFLLEQYTLNSDLIHQNYTHKQPISKLVNVELSSHDYNAKNQSLKHISDTTIQKDNTLKPD